MEQPKTEPIEPRPAEAPKGQGGLEAEVLKLSPGKDDIIVVKLTQQPYRGEIEQIEEHVKKAVGADTKVLVLLPEHQIELIPRRSGHYGIWISETEENRGTGWLTFANDMIFHTTSLGVAVVKQRNGEYAGKGEIRIINDDGTPGGGCMKPIEFKEAR